MKSLTKLTKVRALTKEVDILGNEQLTHFVDLPVNDAGKLLKTVIKFIKNGEVELFENNPCLNSKLISIIHTHNSMQDIVNCSVENHVSLFNNSQSNFNNYKDFNRIEKEQRNKEKENLSPTPPIKEKEKNKKEKEKEAAAKGVREDLDLENLKLFFNQTIANYSAQIPTIKSKIKGNRRSLLLARIKEYGICNVKQVIEIAAKSSFLNGNNNRSFLATFDWIIKPNNFVKILDGNYNNNTFKEKLNYDPKTQRLESYATIVNEFREEQHTSNCVQIWQ